MSILCAGSTSSVTAIFLIIFLSIRFLINVYIVCRVSPGRDSFDSVARLSTERSLSYTGAKPVSPDTEPRSRSFDHQRDEAGVDKGIVWHMETLVNRKESFR